MTTRRFTEDEEDAFALTDGDKHSQTWLRLVEYLNHKLAEKRGKNDGPLTPDQTATIRGHIECLKAILSLGDESPQDD